MSSSVNRIAVDEAGVPGSSLDDEAWLGLVRFAADDPPLGRIGPYEVLGQAGRGGQGLVYRARQPNTGREVALKRLSAGVFATPEMRQRFEREIEAAAALEHPHIVTLYGGEVLDDQLVLVMQWVDGVPFDAWTRPADGPARPIQGVLSVFARVCDAIHHAHQRGIIHRDLKPANIMVDRDGQPHVLDFGLAKLSRDEDLTLTQTGNFLGTPAYAAPEQLSRQNAEVDVRTDVYALGAILYQALGGRRPFQEVEDFAGLVAAVQHVEPPPPSAANHAVPRDLDRIVLKAIAKEKERRYGSVQALAEDVQRFLDGQAVLAHPPSAIYRCRKFLRRNAAVTSLAALALTAILTLGVVSTVQAAREHGLRVAADTARGAAEREARIQRDTADALVAVIERVTSSANNRRSIEIKSLAAWLVEPIEKDKLNLRPDVLIKLHKNVADLYRWTRNYEAAIHHNERAVEASNALDYPDPKLHSWLLGRRSAMLRFAGRYVEAEQAAREALHFADTVFGRISESGANALEHSFLALRRLGRFEEAETAIQEAVNIRDQVEESLADIANARLWLAEVWVERNEFDRAIAYMIDLLETLRAAGKGRDAPTLWALRRLGLVTFQLGRFEESERFLGELANIRMTRNGLKYARTSSDFQSHAWALHALGRYEETIRRLEQALVYPENEARTTVTPARMRFQMAVAMLASGRDDEGRRQLLRALSKGKVTSPGNAGWDARAAAVEAAIREHQLRYDEHLGEKLGEFAWVMSERNRFGIVQEASEDATDMDESAEAPEP